MQKEETKTKLQDFLKGFLTLRMIVALATGAIAGYAYYVFVGCSSGSCAITSNPVNTILYGMLMGGVLGYKEKKKDKSEDADQLEANEVKDIEDPR